MRTLAITPAMLLGMTVLGTLTAGQQSDGYTLPSRRLETRRALETRRTENTPPTAATLAGQPGKLLLPGQVSDPEGDLRFLGVGGVSQANSATAWCSPNVVTAFNDGGAYLETYSSWPKSTVVRHAYSTTNGARYRTGRPLTAADYVWGTPSVACTDKNHFFIVLRSSSSIVLFSSNDGGATFAPQEVTSAGFGYPSVVADPSDPARSTLYIAFTTLTSGDPRCGGQSSGAVFIRSIDGGATWSAPAPAEPFGADWCSPNLREDVELAVGPGPQPTLHAAIWAQVGGTETLINTRSTDGGASWGVVASAAIPTPGNSWDFYAQGGLAFSRRPAIAVDWSSLPTRGNVYVAWTAGGPIVSANSAIFGGGYRFADVMVERSIDGGATFEAPLRANDNAEPLPGTSEWGTDQYQPTVAVDTVGVAMICFFDRRRDPSNFMIDRECARSADGGASWANSRKTQGSFWPMPGGDLYLDTTYGDGDTIASDFALRLPGFRGAYTSTSGGNPDVRSISLK